MPEENNYNVVFEYTQEAEHPNCRYWRSYKNEEEFNEQYTPQIQEIQIAIAKDVSDERAIEICDERRDLSLSAKMSDMPNIPGMSAILEEMFR